MFDNFKPLVAQAIDDNLTIATKDPQQQMQHLLAETLSILDRKAILPIRLIVAVDALDECFDRGQAEALISLLTKELKDSQTFQLKDLQTVQLRFLIISRREEHIKQAFSQLEEGLHRPVPLEKIRLDEEGGNDEPRMYRLGERRYAALCEIFELRGSCLAHYHNRVCGVGPRRDAEDLAVPARDHACAFEPAVECVSMNLPDK